MSIDYTIHLGDKTFDRYGEACYAGMDDELSECFSKKCRYEDRPMFRFELRIGHGTLFRKYVKTRKERSTYHRIFDSMFSTWLEGHASYTQYANGERRSIVYYGSCPFWLMVATGGIYRMYTDMACFIHHWKLLDKYNLHPIMQYWVAVNIKGYGANAKVLDLDKQEVSLGSNTGHMPFDSHRIDLDGIVSMMERDNDFSDLPSMYDQYYNDEHLGVTGRDEYFCSRSGDDNNWIIHEAKEIGFLPPFDPTKPSYAQPPQTVSIPQVIKHIINPRLGG